MKKISLLTTIVLALYIVIGGLLSPVMAQSNDFWEITEGQELVIDFDAYNPNETRLNLYFDISELSENLRNNIAPASFDTTFDQNSGTTTGTFQWTPAIGTAGEYYPINIVVEDPASGYTDYQIIKLTVIAAENIIDFSADDTSGVEPHDVSFTVETTTSFDSFHWTFGNGDSSNDRNPSYTYHLPGIFDVTLTGTLPGGSTRTVEKNAYITVTSPPTVAEFSASPTNGDAPLSVDFDSDDSSGDIEMWLWKFGDGETSSEPNPTHEYNTADTYDVELTIIAYDGTIDTEMKTDYISVLQGAPSAFFTANPRSGTGSLTVHFTDESSGEIDNWSWDFDDDGTIDRSGSSSDDRNPTYTYTAPGIYNVKLIITGNGGSDEQRRIGYIRVYATAPIADFEADTVSGDVPLTVSFTDRSEGSVDSWSWDFGDGSPTDPTQNPTHTYTSVGTYTVELAVSGSGGSDSITKTNYINVDYAPLDADFSAIPIDGEIINGVIEGVAPLVVSFMDSSTGDIETWFWSFGDGDTSTSQNPIHYYDNSGTYTVTFTIQGPGGSDTAVKGDFVIVYEPEPPEAGFTASVREGMVPLTVNFTNLSTGVITANLWNFGDGQTSTEKNPSHTYQAVGTYTVSIAVGSPGGTDLESKSAYIVVSSSAGPMVTITSPQDNSGVSEQYITVSGILGGDIESVEVLVSATNFAGLWETAAISSNSFTCEVEVPTTGGNIAIIAMATDAYGVKIADNIRVIYGYVRVIELPDYYTVDDNSLNLTGIAVAQDILDLMRPDPDYAFPTGNEIYGYGHQYNLSENSLIDELDPDGLKYTLGHFDIYDTSGDITGFGDQLLGYNFSVFSMEGTEEGFAEYLKEIVHWMSWPVMEGNPFKSDGSDIADEPYVPVAVPLYANTAGYSRWILANGCAASIDPYEGKIDPWKYGYEVNDVTVYGLYLTDPETSGIGEDVYVSSAALDDYLKPMPTESIAGKYGADGEMDKYSGKYVMVADPPEEECDLEVTIANPRVNESTLTLIEMAEYINDEATDKYSRHLVDGALMVDLDESEATAYFSTDAKLTTLFRPGATDEKTSAISWKDIIDPMLLVNEDFRRAIDGSIARAFIKVYRTDTQKDYYIIPFDKFIKGRFLSYAAILVDARDGHFLQASYVNEPTRYVQIQKEQAIEKVISGYPELTGERIQVRLVWCPDGPTLSPFYPWWEVIAGEKRFYIVDK